MNTCKYCGEQTGYNNLICEDCRDDNHDDSEDYYQDWLDRELEEKAILADNCKCGAWLFDKNGVVVHVADCCCGAE